MSKKVTDKKNTVKKPVATVRKRKTPVPEPAVEKDPSEVIDEAENLAAQGIHDFIHSEELARMSFYELRELRHYYELENDEVRIAEVDKFLEGKKEQRIEKPPFAIRIWSSFYEKYTLRAGLGFALVLWLIFIKGNVPDAIDLAAISGEHFGGAVNVKGFGELPLSKIILFIFLFAVEVLWRFNKALTDTGQKNLIPFTKFRDSVRILVVKRDGRRASFASYIIRDLFKTFPLMFITAATMMLFKDQRGIHDRIFGTYVLKADPEADLSEREIADFIEREYR